MPEQRHLNHHILLTFITPMKMASTPVPEILVTFRVTGKT